MINFETPKEPKNEIMIAQKVCFKGALFGHISNLGGKIDLGQGYSLEFVGDEKFVTLQLYHSAMNASPKTQSWTKSKKVVIKPQAVVKKKLELHDDKVVQEELI